MLIDKYAYNSKIADTNVCEKLLFAGMPFLACLFSRSVALCCTVILCMSVATLCWGRIGILKYSRLLLIPFGFILVGLLAVIVTGVNENSTVIMAFSLFGRRYGITHEGLQLSITIFLRAFSSLCCFYFLVLNTPINRLLSFLQQLKVSQILIDLMELIYRFSFMIWDEARRIHASQAARLGYKDFSTSIKSLAELVSMLFENCISRVDRINICLESRCFNGNFSYLVGGETATGSSAISIKLQIAALYLCLFSVFVIERIML